MPSPRPRDRDARMADPDRPVVLVGLMGAGKTSVATRLAAALGRQLRDSDQDLQQRYGQSAAEQYRQHGARVLHAREAEALRDALAQRPPPVVAAAASVVEDPACRAALAGAFVVWLDAPPGVLAGRFESGWSGASDPGPRGHRPQFHRDPQTMLTTQRRRRVGWFRQVADLVVDVSDHDPEQAAGAVLAALGRSTGRD